MTLADRLREIQELVSVDSAVPLHEVIVRTRDALPGIIEDVGKLRAAPLSETRLVEAVEGLKLTPAVWNQRDKDTVAACSVVIDTVVSLIRQQAIEAKRGERGAENADGAQKSGAGHIEAKQDVPEVSAEVVEALEFYAKPARYKSPYTGGLGELYFDCGDKARAALAALQQPKQEEANGAS